MSFLSDALAKAQELVAHLEGAVASEVQADAPIVGDVAEAVEQAADHVDGQSDEEVAAPAATEPADSQPEASESADVAPEAPVDSAPVDPAAPAE